MVAWIGGRQVPIVYDRKARAAGESKYPLAKMVRFAADAVTAFSVVPLMASMTIGWIMAVIGFAFFVYSIVGWLLDATLPGWTSLMAAVGLLGGMQFLMLGIIGAYLGRLYDQSKGRPLFLIRDIVTGQDGGDR
jgi:dolichol-phosphate mannosyltransferase